MIIVVAVLVYIMIYGVIPTILYRLQNIRLKKRRIINNIDDIYLTFDDGVDSKYTREVLKVLSKYDIKGTFFVVAQFAKENPEIIKEMKEAGHVIGLHSLKHKNQILQSPWATKKDFSESIKILESLDVSPQFFRAPWGHFSLAALKEIKKARFKIVLWNVIVGDWKANIEAKTIADKLLKSTEKGDIICLHDGRGKNEAPKRTVAALEIVLPIWKAKGYTFKTVEELYEE